MCCMFLFDSYSGTVDEARAILQEPDVKVDCLDQVCRQAGYIIDDFSIVKISNFMVCFP